jgi:hypothetical protein
MYSFFGDLSDETGEPADETGGGRSAPAEIGPRWVQTALWEVERRMSEEADLRDCFQLDLLLITAVQDDSPHVVVAAISAVARLYQRGELRSHNALILTVAIRAATSENRRGAACRVEWPHPPCSKA